VRPRTWWGVAVWASGADATWRGPFPEAASPPGFEVNGISLASSALTIDLDFRDDGTIAGRVDADVSLLWPLHPALTGTWNAAGDISLTLRDRLPAEDSRYSPLARELGRELVLTGKRTRSGIDGAAIQTLTGLRPGPVLVQGAFSLHRQGPLTGLVHAPNFIPEDATAPTWLAPPGLDTAACDDLGDLYGTDATLTEPSPACETCQVGACSPEDSMDCGIDLRTAAYNLGPCSPRYTAAAASSLRAASGHGTTAPRRPPSTTLRVGPASTSPRCAALTR